MRSKSIARSAAGLAALRGAALLAYAGLVRPWHLRWGATPDETGRPLPGDELVDNPRFVSTRAVTINAPAEAGNGEPTRKDAGGGRTGRIRAWSSAPSARSE